MVGLFADQIRDSRTAGPSLAIARLWAHTMLDLIATAPQQHLRKESPVLQPVEPTNVPAAADRSPLQRVVVVIASVPLIAWVVMWVVAPDFIAPVFSVPPAVFGFPLGVVVITVAGGMALLGWLLSRRTRSVRVALGAVAFLTIPALLLIVMTPALILVIVNLA
jgi:hypothetical protein